VSGTTLTQRLSTAAVNGARLHLDLIDQHTRAMEELTPRIEG
jgi:hypothetical protein